ncbi:N-acetyltransferase family protein [Heyndrickxia sporothermodurans]
MIIRKAEITDAKGIAKVHVDCWRTTYKNIIPDAFLEKLSYDQRMKNWETIISNEGNYAIVAENDEGEIIGFADGGKRETNQIENSGDLTSIYILESYQGKGIGRKLVEPLFDHFERLGYTRIFVEVLEKNESRYFYEALGAKYLKSESITIGGAKLNLLTYEWNLNERE